jgi:hypothetical protein
MGEKKTRKASKGSQPGLLQTGKVKEEFTRGCVDGRTTEGGENWAL